MSLVGQVSKTLILAVYSSFYGSKKVQGLPGKNLR